MSEFLQHLANGLVLGGAYALIGIGLTMIFGIMNVINFAHGEFYMLGAYAVYALSSVAGLGFFPATFLAVVVVVLIGLVCERLLLRPVYGTPIETPMIVTIGLMIIFQNLILRIFGGDGKSIATPFPTGPIAIGPITVSWLRVFILLVGVVSIVLTNLLIQRTKIGRAVRAVFQDREAAALMGVNLDHIYSFTFSLGTGLAALAGALLGSLFLVYPAMGTYAVAKAFAVVIMGGLGSFKGAIACGLILGISESLGAGYVSSGYREGISFLMVLLILLFKPAGLFGRAQTR